MRPRLRWLTPLAALGAVVAGMSVPQAVAAPTPSSPTVTDTSRLTAPDSVLSAGWRTSADRAVTTSGDDNGFNVLVADASSGYQWRTAATLTEPGFDTDQWIGQACVTGSGDRAVVTYAPRSFTNDETAFDGGAFAAVVDLRTGAVRKLAVHVSLAYYDPGCGTGETATLSALTNSTTTVDVVDATTAKVTRSMRATGQLTSVVPYAGSVAAAHGNRVVSVDANGAERTLTTESGAPFRLSVDSAGGLAYQVPAGQQVQVRRLAAGRSTLLGTGALGAVRVLGTAGHAYLVGPDAPRIPLTAAQGGLRAFAAPVTGEPSTTGALVVTTATEATGQTAPAAPRVRISATVTANAKPVSFAVAPRALQPAQGNAMSPALAGSAAASPRAGTFDPSTVPWDPDRGCAVPRNDPTIQTFQATAKQVEWAADLAVQGQLTVTRPANWEGSGMPQPWTPQGMFPLRQLSGGGRVPAQVLLGLLAQESNTMQASPHAVDSITGNVNQGGFYGNGVSWSTVDCGYGVGQVTTGMAMSTPAGTPVADGNMAFTTAEQQQAIATDYASNIAASLNILIDKWNAMKAAGIIANNGDPSQIENWYFALWAYNSGIQPDASHGNTTGCTPGPNCTDGFGDWGLGWFNNPANPRLPADRKVFNTKAGDTKVPNEWTYPELVIGWSATPVVRYNYTAGSWGPAYKPSYWGQNGPVSVATPYTVFCTSADHCTPGGTTDITGKNPAGLCSASNSHCWWHLASNWIDCTKTPCGAQILSYGAGSAEPSGTDPYPADCNAGALPSNAVIVDDVTTASVAPCNKTWASLGSFALKFGQSSFANCATNCIVYHGKIDFHQLGVGFGGHIWFTHTVAAPVENSGTVIDGTVTGTWTPPAATTGWTRIKVHVPNNGATTAQADYVINLGNGQTRHRVVNQHWNTNTWADLGTFDLSAGASVSLSNLNSRVPVEDVDGGDIAFDAMAFVPSVKPTIDYVAIGDSYSSGESIQPYNPDSDNSTDACHRSPQAYPYQIAYPSSTQTIQQEAANNGAADFAFLACSGARSVQTTAAAVGAPTAVNTPWSNQDSFDSHEPYQIDDSGYLDQDTTLVTLSMGGDDARFATILKGCFLEAPPGFCADPSFSLTVDGTVDPQPLTTYEPHVINLLQTHLEEVYRQIHTVAPNARIIVLGYPHLVSRATDNVYCLVGLQPAINWLNQMGDLLDTVTGNAVSDVAAGGVNIQFVDSRAVFEGHDACQADGLAWINSIIVSSSPPFTGSFHPKAIGQSIFAALINAAL